MPAVQSRALWRNGTTGGKMIIPIVRGEQMGESQTDPDPWIDLVREPAFDLGAAHVRPAYREVAVGPVSVSLQPRVMQVLVCLAQAGGEPVSREVLAQRCWGGVAVSEDAINRCIQRLRRLSEEEAADSFAIETIPRVGFRLRTRGEAAQASGQPAEPTLPVVAARPLWRRPRVRVAVGAALACLLIASAAVLLWPRVPVAPRVSIAALKTLQGGEDARTFGARVTDRMTGLLNETGIQTGRSPRFELPSLRPRPPNLVLGGSVNQTGGTTTVRLFLKDARSDTALWTREFAGPAAKQDRLIEQAAGFATETIYAALEPRQQKGLNLDPQALALYLEAFDLQKVGGYANAGGVRRMYEQAVARAPDFALGRGYLALTMAFEASQSPPSEQAQRYDQAEAEAKRAIAIDPANAGAAYSALSYVEGFRNPRDLAAQERHLLDGIKGAPHFAFLGMRECQLLRDVGRFAAATESCRRALGLRPMHPSVVSTAAALLTEAGAYDEAEPLTQRMLQLQPHDGEALSHHFFGAAMTGQFDEAERTLRDRDDGMGAWPSETRAALEAWLQAMRTRSPADGTRAAQALAGTVVARRLDNVAAAQLLALAGQNEAAFDMLDQALPRAAIGEDGGFLMYAALASLRTDPRYWGIVARSSLPAYWRATKTWPDFCADPAHPIDCPAMLASAEGGAGRPATPPKG
jgi:DNA-binding winged helix-turn-helix (wHTH) protein/tetratricopeptide (TPR) repeat protein